MPDEIPRYKFYKVDRTLAVLGIILVAAVALKVLGVDGKDIALAGVSVLGGYIGGRAGK